MKDIEEVKCKKCKKYFIFNKKKDVLWDESGYGYSTKLVKCPICGTFHVLEYVEDSWLKLGTQISHGRR